MALRGKPWTPEEEAFALANVGTMTDAEIGDHLGRTHTAVANWRYKHRNTVERRNDVESYIRRNWDSMTTQAMASVLAISQQAVRAAAERLGLESKPGAGCGRPKGYTIAQIAWAAANCRPDFKPNVRDCEARMIDAILRDPAARGMR